MTCAAHEKSLCFLIQCLCVFVSTECDEDDVESDDDEPAFNHFYGKQSKEIFDKTFKKLVNEAGTSLVLRYVFVL